MSIATTPDDLANIWDETLSLTSHESARSLNDNSPKSRTVRKRNLTSKGRDYAKQLKSKKRDIVYRELKEQINKILNLRDSVNDLETLQTERDTLDRLKENLNDVQSDFDCLLETDLERETSYRWFDLRDREYMECRVKICESLQAVERESYQSSCRSSRRSARSIVSHKTRSSARSSKSGSSATNHLSIALLDATAKSAKLKAEIEYLDNEKLCRRLKLERDLAIANAEEQALKRLTVNDEIKTETKTPKNTEETKRENAGNVLNSRATLYIPDVPTIEQSFIVPEQTVQQGQVNPNLNFAINQIIALQAKQTEMSSLIINQQRLSQLPIKEPPTFSGEPFEYPAFITAFDSIITANVPADRDRLYFLDKYTDGKANKVIKGFLAMTSDNAYKEARKLLDQRFGNPIHVAQAYKTRLYNWPEIKDQDCNGVQDYSDFLVKCDEAMKTMQTMEDLDSTQVLLNASAKLPSYSGVKWCRYAHEIQSRSHRVKFSDFVKFVKEEADLATDPIFSPEALKRERRKGDNSKNKTPSQNVSRPKITSNTGQVFATSSSATQHNTSQRIMPIASQRNTHTPSQLAAPKQLLRSCPLCFGPHSLDKCDRLINSSVEARIEIVKSRRLCFQCFKPSHMASDCKSLVGCKECGKRHHTLLHGTKPSARSSNTKTANPAEELKGNGPQKETHIASSNAINVTLSSISHVNVTNHKILPVLLSHKENPAKEIKVYALLDDASDTTFISENAKRELNLTGTQTTLSLNTMLGREEISVDRIEGLTVQRLDKRAQIDLPKTYARPQIPCRREHIPTPEIANEWPHLQKIKHKIAEFDGDLEVGLLIGCNCPKAIKPKEVILGKSEDPYAIRTLLGWSIVGPVVKAVPPQDDEDISAITHCIATQEIVPDTNDKVSFLLENQTKEVISPSTIKQMFEMDFSERNGKSADQSLSAEDRKFLSIAKDGIHQLKDGHFELPLPLKDECNLPYNRSMAVRRLNLLKRKFESKGSEKYREDYIKFMCNIIESGFAEIVPATEDAKKVWYIPHHGVYHPKKPGKIRVVFDCAAEYLNDSLNKHLLQGPDLTNSLAGVLCRFRQESTAFMCDIEAMFHQVKVSAEYRDLLRFLWWEDGDTSRQPLEYRMTVHLFGATSSPGCANFALKTVADEYEKENGTAAANFLRNDFYVDDGLKSTASTDEAVKLISEVKQMCKNGGFNLHKFVSNDKQVIRSINEKDRADTVKNINIDLDSLPIERALGIHWCTESDCFQFDIKLPDKPSTRRGILSTVSSMFDPLGFIAPILLEGKAILQELCRHSVGWDDPIPECVQTRWAAWKNQLLKVQSVSIPRCYKPSNFGDLYRIELHHFSDASVKGYGQCSYLRLIDHNQRIHCVLVMGKSRVAPLKPVTIPRLELTAAVCSVRVSQQLRKELEYPIDEEVFWTDSSVVLGYINNQSRRFHVYVANRVQEIQDSTSVNQWRYVESKFNPADDASRGIKAQDICESSWISGPEFLWKPESAWPDSCKTKATELQTNDPEVKKSVVMATSCDVQPSKMATIEERISYFSDWFRAKRALALCIVYIRRLRDRIHKKQRTYDGKLDVETLNAAEQLILRTVQAKAFKDDLRTIQSFKRKDEETASRSCASHQRKAMKQHGTLYKLDPYIDQSGILRVGGRLRRSSMKDYIKHPIILPKGHHITEIIIRYYHGKVKHQGKSSTLNEIRASGFWLIGGSSSVGSVIQACVTCQRLRGSTQSQKMADLPEDRIECSAPFTYSAVDYFGPFIIKEGRKEMKRYGVLFTCMASRAIHIEVAKSLETDSFINALRRFIARRGTIRQLRSDQGTNLVGAKNELKQALAEMNTDKIKSELLEDNCDFITFKMNVPSASHMGGVWERQIRSVRSILSSLLYDNASQLDEEALRTLMCEAEAIVNSRPLTTDQLTDPDSQPPLTPNHLLTMKSKIALAPPGAFQSEDIYSRKRWRRVQHLANEFWSRWKKEFLLSLQQRQKWTHPRRNMRCGDIVLIKDQNLPRNVWQLARVSTVYPSADGQVRKVEVALADSHLDKSGKKYNPTKYLDRPVHKLVLLMPAED